MDREDLKRNLEFEYWGIKAANPGWKKTLAQFLRDRMKPYHKPGKKASKAKKAK